VCSLFHKLILYQKQNFVDRHLFQAFKANQFFFPVQGELKISDSFEMQISRTAFLQFDRRCIEIPATKHIK